MNNSEHEAARKIIGVLKEGNARPDPALREKLALARRAALAAYDDAERAPAWALARAGAGNAGHSVQQSRLRLVLAGAAFLCVVALAITWHTQSQTDIAEIDAGLLTDELPINAYLDRGFDSWLKRVSR